MLSDKKVTRMKNKLNQFTYKLENNFFLATIRQGLSMMIPFIMTGCFACVLMNLPIPAYQQWIHEGLFSWVYILLNTIYSGVFDLFSVALVICISVSYAMAKNEQSDGIAIYVIVSLAAFGVQLNLGTSHFNVGNLGSAGSFSAILITMFSCYLYSLMKQNRYITLKKYTAGIDRIGANAIQALIPTVIIVGLTALFTRFLGFACGVYNLQDLITAGLTHLIGYVDTGFASGLLYCFFVDFLWFFGFHGSHCLQSVADSCFRPLSSGSIVTMDFYVIYAGIGGCGVSLCALLVLLIFFRKKRTRNIARLSAIPVLFNINEILYFGIPFVLNPILAIPFTLTATVCFCLAYGVTVLGLVPPVTTNVLWTTPALLNGYLATGSIRGSILQFVCLAVGMAIYYPFLALNEKVQTATAKEDIQELVRELQEKEEQQETPQFLTYSNRLGQMARVLLNDLENSIGSEDLFLLFQPQVDNSGYCIGGEALLRWNHPVYGYIYPPLIIYLAKEGGILPKLEERIFDMAASAIKTISLQYDHNYKISVNITAKSLAWNIEDCIAQKLTKYQIPAEMMWLEITEQDALMYSNQAMEKIKGLKEAGHTLLIDDFGMGHTSLVYLQSSYLDIVKLDGSLVRNIIQNPTNQKIISSIVELCRKLNGNVIAEYVETEEQQKELYSLGCKLYQGYLYSRPVPLEEFVSFLKNHQCPGIQSEA